MKVCLEGSEDMDWVDNEKDEWVLWDIKRLSLRVEILERQYWKDRRREHLKLRLWQVAD